jgi:hypothetical protein
LSLQDASAIAQVVIAIVTLAGVLVSIWLSTKALREVERDRAIRQAPHLLFESGGWELPVEFLRAGAHIPGLNPRVVREYFPDIPSDAESVRLRPHSYGTLRNYGLGPAINVEVTWLAREVQIGREKFEINKEKRREPLYTEDLNFMPSNPSHLPPGASGAITRLPTFIEKDIEKSFTRVEGTLRISCFDIYGEKYVTHQEVLVFPRYSGQPPTVHVTFGDPMGTRTEQG